jgi:hypothetical protein
MTTKAFSLHTEVINYVAAKIGAKVYLEIGVYNPDHNFNRIKVGGKTSVDPNPSSGAIWQTTSDEYFKASVSNFDLIFIDGLHHADQVKNDISNSWDRLNNGGVIILHDTNPPTEKTTCIPRGSQREWCGDVYKAIYQIDSPEIFTIKEDYGITILRKTKGAELKMSDSTLTWQEFDENRDMLLNLVSWEQATKIIDGWH